MSAPSPDGKRNALVEYSRGHKSDISLGDANVNAATGYVLKKIADAGISRITETLRRRNDDVHVVGSAYGRVTIS